MRGAQLASIAVLVREDGKVLMVRHPSGPFAGRWSMPLIGVADAETAEDALERMLTEMLNVQPGPYQFLDTLYLGGAEGDRFIGNVFTCVDWQGEPRFSRQIFDDAVWLTPSDPGALELLPEVREFLKTAFQDEGEMPAAVTYDAVSLTSELASARDALIAAYEAVPREQRGEVMEEGGWSPLDVIAHAADAEAYALAEVRRCLDEAGRVWTPFNDAQWNDLHRLYPAQPEDAHLARLTAVREATAGWLRWMDGDTLSAWINHPEQGVVQVGSRVSYVASHDREHTEQLRRMWQTATIRAALDDQ